MDQPRRRQVRVGKMPAAAVDLQWRQPGAAGEEGALGAEIAGLPIQTWSPSSISTREARSSAACAPVTMITWSAVQLMPRDRLMVEAMAWRRPGWPAKEI